MSSFSNGHRRSVAAPLFGAALLLGFVSSDQAMPTVEVVHSFTISGRYPLAALALGSDGALYGSTVDGGSSDSGTLFKIGATGTFTSLHSFNRSDGAGPLAALALGSDGALYGSTSEGGSSNDGTLFKIDARGAFTSLHSFDYSVGVYPLAALALGSDGALYGSTLEGGGYDYGTLFKIDPSGSFTSLHTFNGSDGSYPSAALVLGSDGALYGSTRKGGSSNDGTLFKIDPSGTFTSLHTFNRSDGSYPSAALALGSDGALYGSTVYGGSSHSGTLFKIDASGTFTSLHSFNGNDGSHPSAALALASDGALYGSTIFGGSYNSGTLFKIDASGAFTSLHIFEYYLDGGHPRAALALGSDGAHYGSTSEGSSSRDGALSRDGTLFKIDATGTFTSLHSFQESVDGAYPEAALALGSDGALYGTTQRGGSGGGGVLFRLGHERLEFDGFYSPVDNLPVVNRVTAGSAVPVRFSLAGNPGTDVLAPGSPTSSTIPCDATAPINRIEVTRTAALSGLMYSETGIYTYVWKTEKAWAGTCREFVLELTDGSTHRAHFKFTRRRPRHVELRN